MIRSPGMPGEAAKHVLEMPIGVLVFEIAGIEAREGAAACHDSRMPATGFGFGPR